MTVHYKMIQVPVTFGPVLKRVIDQAGSSRRALNLTDGNYVTPKPDQNVFDFSPDGMNALRAAGVDLFSSNNGEITALDMRLWHDNDGAQDETTLGAPIHGQALIITPGGFGGWRITRWPLLTPEQSR